MSTWNRFDRLSHLLEKRISSPLRIGLWRHLLQPLPAASRWTPFESLGLGLEARVRLQRDVEASSAPVPVATVDQDGLLLSHYGPLSHRLCVDGGDFVDRRRHAVRIIADARGVAVEKRCSELLSFVREVRALLRLRAAGCRVPELFQIDAARLTLWTAFVPGAVLRDVLAEHGARVFDRHPHESDGDVYALRRWRIREGQRFLARAVGPAFNAQLREQVARAHAAGIALCDVKFGNIILGAADGAPWLIDFEMSRYFAWRGNPLFRELRAEDLATVRDLCEPDGGPPAAVRPQPAPVLAPVE